MASGVEKLLKKSFGFSSFRPGQKQIVEAILEGRDLFAALPTGGGKSLCYQLPSLLLPGVTVVVSPLIALMEDQVTAARENGLPAAYLNSSLEAEEVRALYRRLHAGEIKLLYLSPERLSHPGLRDRLKEWGVSLFAVDEAHCISEWGHEFRPEYRNLTNLREAFPAAGLAAFTATATPRVQEDVISLLGLRDPVTLRGNFDRPEIFYRIRSKRKVKEQILRFVSDHPGEAGIVYRSTRKSVEETAAYLAQRGVPALGYHGGMSDGERRENQAAFVRDEAQVMVATIAFGMGIDKSNVRWVVHGDLPRSIEAYYQETGRAGRDGEAAEACLFFSPGDTRTIRYHLERMEVPEEREQGERNLVEILAFIEAGECRRSRLLRHFGQEHPGECGGCDVCVGETVTRDATVEAQKVMSAAVRTGERFGSHYLADLLTGVEDGRMVRLGHHKLPTFGVGSELPKEWWVRLAGDLESAGLLSRTEGPRSGLQVTDRGWDVLQGRTAYRRTDRPEGGSGAGGKGSGRRRSIPGAVATAGGSEAEEPAEGDALAPAEAEALFRCLKALRLSLAREAAIPPYMVFSDRTLRSMVERLPRTSGGFLNVKGVGERKAERYGQQFLSRIATFLATGGCPE
ncbi:MAG: DNA helicase RecQ [Alkalispirochaetaceae bacterium]